MGHPTRANRRLRVKVSAVRDRVKTLINESASAKPRRAPPSTSPTLETQGVNQSFKTRSALGAKFQMVECPLSKCPAKEVAPASAGTSLLHQSLQIHTMKDARGFYFPVLRNQKYRTAHSFCHTQSVLITQAITTPIKTHLTTSLYFCGPSCPVHDPTRSPVTNQRSLPSSRNRTKPPGGGFVNSVSKERRLSGRRAGRSPGGAGAG